MLVSDSIVGGMVNVFKTKASASGNIGWRNEIVGT